MTMTLENLLDIEDYAWHLMLDADLVIEGHAEDFDAAKKLFLLKYPTHERVWDRALKEYYDYGNDTGC